MKNKKILALDFGNHTVGVSYTDEFHITISFLPVIRRDKPNKLRRTLSKIEEIIKLYNIDEIIIGFPYNMDGSEGDRCKKTREFKKLLEKRIDIKVTLFDERLTTVEAYEIMKEYNIDKKKQREIVDSVAAAVILRSYINQLDR